MLISRYMRLIDIKIFQQAAEQFNCIIIVRRLNPASLQYVGKQGYIPKSIFCKAKTAKNNVTIPETGQQSRVAGLVVDPTMPGMSATFNNIGDAQQMWKKFMDNLGVKGLNTVDLYNKLPVERGWFLYCSE